MSGESDEKLMKLVNTSGFPFQIVISNLIKTTKDSHGWSVFSSEAPWQNPETGRSGYIDLILQNYHETQLMVIECKRVRDAQWVFLIPNRRQLDRRHGTLWISYMKNERKSYGWWDVNLDPESPEAEFCVVRGQDKNSQPMLERIASELIEATESIALEELKFIKPANVYSEFGRLYSSVIVTTAQLKICIFDPSDVSISDGNLSNAEFITVPFVRFRKSLTTSLSPNVKPTGLEQAIRGKTRTVFVINASSLIDIIKIWEIDNGSLTNILSHFV